MSLSSEVLGAEVVANEAHSHHGAAFQEQSATDPTASSIWAPLMAAFPPIGKLALKQEQPVVAAGGGGEKSRGPLARMSKCSLTSDKSSEWKCP